MLSGGLDSSSIAATARGLQPGDSSLPVFNAVFTRLPPSLDAPFVEALLAQGGYEAHRVPIGTTGPLSAMTPDRDDEPLRVPGLALQLALYAAARDAGCTAILDGDGGDDAVSHGTARLAELSRAGRAGALVREARALRARTGTPMRSTLVSWGVRPLVPEPVLRARRVLWGRDPWGAALATPINPDFARSIDLPARLAALTGQTAGVPRSAREEHHRLLTTGLTAHSLGVLDRAAARVPVEPRYPFLDHRLLELCLALPSDQKLSDGWTRVVARRAMAGILPDEVRWRGGKAAMTGAMVEGLRSVDGTLLREIVEGDGPVWEFADRAATRAVHRRFLERPHGRDALVMWLIASTDLWLRNQRDTPE
jgi:asparagine synthase (glutamine-hydrolysing)